MEGVGDFPLRLWIWLCSAPSSMGTPFLRATQTWPNSVPEGWAPELLVPGVGDGLPYALVPQIMSPHPEQFLRVAHQLLPHSGVVEVNCGCPAPTVVGKGAGSGLLKNPSEFHSYIKSLSQSLEPAR